ncbi:MAG: radical SAM protein [Candidatus Omnitrophota bacterium]
MKVTLIYPNINNIPSYSFGLGIIAAYLKQNGHKVQGFYIDSETEEDIDLVNIEKQIKKFNPGLIGFSSVSNQYNFVKLIARHLKRSGINAKIIVGGAHPTIAPEEVIKENFIDMVCVGEGEDAILELVNKLDKKEDISNVRNIWLKKGDRVLRNGLRPLIKDLGRLPFADRNLFDFRNILEKRRGWVNILVSRGCPFQCSYCINHYLGKINKEKFTIRMRPIDHVLSEIAEIEKGQEIKMVNFADDAFTVNKEWTLKFCKEYPKKFKKYPFACNARTTNFDETLACALKKAGCAEVKMGLESGSGRVREEILNRSMTNGQIEKAFSVAKKFGIRTWAFNMIGIPTETKNELLETIKLNAKIRPYILWCSILFPYKGTKLYERCLKEGIIDKNKQFKYTSYFNGTILKLKDFTEADIVRYKTMFRWYVDAYSNIEVAPLYKGLVSLFEALPSKMWMTKEAQKLFKELDGNVDDLLKILKKEHYSSRGHLYLNFSAATNWELP